jgi:hypothetical protein
MASSSGAEYESTEILVISWGSGQNQLDVAEPGYEDVNFTPEDSSDDWIETAGPSQCFVDRYENFYFASYYFLQLKAFDKTGRVIFDYSQDTPGYNPEFFQGWLRKIYVDSLCRVYVLGGAGQDYVALTDTSGHLLDKLTPHGLGSGIKAANIFFNYGDILTLYFRGDGYYTFAASSYSAGGAMGWLAKDGNYYYANLEDSSLIRFIKYTGPDLYGTPTTLDETTKAIEGPAARKITFLGVDKNMNIYIFQKDLNPFQTRVLVYNAAFQLTGQIVFPPRANQFKWYMRPFMRPSDGNIYEFRCLDDGLHVIRWSKE